MTVSINGTTGISGVDGSAATPALQGSDTNTGISFGTDEVAINTAGTARATVDSAGRLLVGTSSARSVGLVDQPIQQESTTNTGISFVRNSSADVLGSYVILAKSRGASVNSNTIVQSGDQLGALVFAGADGTDINTQAAYISCFVDGTPGANDMPGRLVFSTTADGASIPTERMRIQGNGSVLFSSHGDESAIIAGTSSGKSISGGTGIMYSARATTSTTSHIVFTNTNGTVGSITSSGSATAYNTSSDYRLKENVVPLTGAADRLVQLPVHRFNFIADPDTTVDGFIAHEVQVIVPEAITGEKDAVDADGNPEYQGIDQSKLVPLLTAALQEAITRIETLEAEVQALKGGN